MLIGLTGYKRSGKDSTANILVAEYGFRRFAFADALRAMAAAADPMISLEGAPDSIRYVFSTYQLGYSMCCMRCPEAVRHSELLKVVGYERAKEVPDFRRFYQQLGAEAARGVLGADVWIKALDRVLPRDPEARAVITDVRFPNEADYIHERDGVLWRIVRPGYGGHDQHESERFIADLPADRVITATNLAELAEAVHAEAGLLNLEAL